MFVLIISTNHTYIHKCVTVSEWKCLFDHLLLLEVVDSCRWCVAWLSCKKHVGSQFSESFDSVLALQVTTYIADQMNCAKCIFFLRISFLLWCLICENFINDLYFTKLHVYFYCFWEILEILTFTQIWVIIVLFVSWIFSVG